MYSLEAFLLNVIQKSPYFESGFWKPEGTPFFYYNETGLFYRKRALKYTA